MDTKTPDMNENTPMIWLEAIHAIISLISSMIVLVSGIYIYVKTKDDIGDLSKKLILFNMIMGGICCSTCIIINWNLDASSTKDFVLIGSGLVNIIPMLVDAWILMMFITVQVQLNAQQEETRLIIKQIK